MPAGFGGRGRGAGWLLTGRTGHFRASSVKCASAADLATFTPWTDDVLTSNIVQATGAARPTFIDASHTGNFPLPGGGARECVGFFGAISMAAAATHFGSAANAYLIIATLRFNDVSSGLDVLSVSGGWGKLYFSSSGVLTWTTNNGTTTRTVSKSVSTATNYVVAIVKDSAGLYMYLDTSTLDVSPDTDPTVNFGSNNVLLTVGDIGGLSAFWLQRLTIAAQSADFSSTDRDQARRDHMADGGLV